MDVVVITYFVVFLVRSFAHARTPFVRAFRARLVLGSSTRKKEFNPTSSPIDARASRLAFRRRRSRAVEMSVTTPPPPPLTFQTFLEKMRQPSAGALVRDVKTFIASLDDDAAERDAARVGRRVQAFLERTEASFVQHPAWRGASASELEASGEGLEKYVMTKAHARVFGRGKRDEARDEALRRRIGAMREIVTAQHLDVAETAHAAASWALAESELGKMNQFKAPRDKLVCVLNTCRIINNTLTTRQGSDGGADDFLPVLVYVTLRANPERLESNLRYIQRFRGESRLVSEAAYFFTNLVSAVRFLGRARASDFTGVDETEFDAALERAGVLEAIELDEDEDEDEEAEEDEEVATRETPVQKPQISVEEMSAALSALSNDHKQNDLVNVDDGDEDERDPPPRDAPPATPESVTQRPPPTAPLHTPLTETRNASPETPTSSMSVPYIPWRTTEDVEAEGATALTASDVAGELTLSDYRFLYAKAEDLTVGDVSKLLHDYKGLALQYESLSRGVAKVLTSLNRSAR